MCRTISRPAVSQARRSLTAGGHVRYQLKTPCLDGTTHVLVELLYFIVRLAALVLKPRVNFTRYHGVFAPNSAHQAQVTKAERWAAMTWPQRLKRVFGIDIETCSVCGGALRLISGIEDPVVIEKILAHLDAKAAAGQAFRRPAQRAAPPPLFALD